MFAPAGLIAYSAWLGERFGDPLAWLHAQASWDREVSGNFVAQVIRSTSEALAALVFGVLLMPVSTGSLLSLSRLGLLAFPALLWLAKHTKDRGGIEVAWLVAGFGMGAVGLAIFVQGGFLA